MSSQIVSRQSFDPVRREWPYQRKLEDYCAKDSELTCKSDWDTGTGMGTSTDKVSVFDRRVSCLVTCRANRLSTCETANVSRPQLTESEHIEKVVRDSQN